MVFAFCVPVVGLKGVHLCLGVKDDLLDLSDLYYCRANLGIASFEIIETPKGAIFERPRHWYINPDFQNKEFYFNPLPPRIYVVTSAYTAFQSSSYVELDWSKVYVWDTIRKKIIF